MGSKNHYKILPFDGKLIFLQLVRTLEPLLSLLLFTYTTIVDFYGIIMNGINFLYVVLIWINYP